MPLELKNIKLLSLGQMLSKNAAEVPDKTAVVDGDRRFSYDRLNCSAKELAAGIGRLGFTKGDRVAIYMKNSAELVITFFAAVKLGLIVTWVSPMYRKNESHFILRNSEAKGVVIFQQWQGYDYLKVLRGHGQRPS
jgi:non-ribosomal peptide synthetase component E (peptide arylation enzyme)